MPWQERATQLEKENAQLRAEVARLRDILSKVKGLVCHVEIDHDVKKLEEPQREAPPPEKKAQASSRPAPVPSKVRGPGARSATSAMHAWSSSSLSDEEVSSPGVTRKEPDAPTEMIREEGGRGEQYAVEPKTGQRMVAPSYRPDGTMRKALPIRPGYVNPEEIPRYVPPQRRAQAQKSAGLTQSGNMPQNAPNAPTYPKLPVSDSDYSDDNAW